MRLLPIAILALAAWVWGKRKKPGPGPGPGPGPVPLPDPDDENVPTPEPEPEKDLDVEGRIELAALLSGLGYPATLGSKNIPYSTRVVWVQDFRKVRNRVRDGEMTRVWPLGSPTKQKRVNKGLSKASLAAAKWAYGSQAAGISWKELVTQARGL